MYDVSFMAMLRQRDSHSKCICQQNITHPRDWSHEHSGHSRTYWSSPHLGLIFCCPPHCHRTPTAWGCADLNIKVNSELSPHGSLSLSLKRVWGIWCGQLGEERVAVMPFHTSHFWGGFFSPEASPWRGAAVFDEHSLSQWNNYSCQCKHTLLALTKRHTVE